MVVVWGGGRMEKERERERYEKEREEEREEEGEGEREKERERRRRNHTQRPPPRHRPQPSSNPTHCSATEKWSRTWLDPCSTKLHHLFASVGVMSWPRNLIAPVAPALLAPAASTPPDGCDGDGDCEGDGEHGMRPSRAVSSVVLPAPDGPRSAVTVPRGQCPLQLLRMVFVSLFAVRRCHSPPLAHLLLATRTLTSSKEISGTAIPAASSARTGGDVIVLRYFRGSPSSLFLFFYVAGIRIVVRFRTNLSTKPQSNGAALRRKSNRHSYYEVDG